MDADRDPDRADDTADGATGTAPASAERTVRFAAGDGTPLVGDIRLPSVTPRAAAIVCHPHPQYGGDRFNNVVTACFEALPADGIATLRFDFRSDFDEGLGERLDAMAALDEVARAAPEVPLVAVGYSFGAMIVAGLDDHRLAAKVLIAPPVGAMPVEPHLASPVLVLSAEHDRFAPPDTARPIVEAWPGAGELLTFDTIGMADHFLVGRAATAASRAVDWLGRTMPGTV